MQSFFQRIHGSAQHRAFSGADTVFYGDKGFGVVGGNSEDSREPAPEDSSGSSKSDSRSHADNIACSKSRGKRRRQGGKGADIASVRGASGKGEADCKRKLPLDKTCTERHIEMSSKQQANHRKPPQKMIYSFNSAA